MRIVFATTEAEPFVKVGGLADVCGALARRLAARGHEVILVLPRYRQIQLGKFGFRPILHTMGVPMLRDTFWCSVHHTRAADRLSVFLIERNDLFDRDGIYDDHGRPWPDNGLRYAFFVASVLELCRSLAFEPDVIHVHDWPTAAIPAILKARFSFDPVLRNTGSVLTVHNLSYQGRFDPSVGALFGLPASLWRPDAFEDHGQLNLMKGGIAFADLITTVSPTYAREILEPELGAGLHEQVRLRRHDLHGILNGVDYSIWHPSTDPHIPVRYSSSDLSGKRICKERLQREMGLFVDANAPLFGVVARLVHQKGLDLILALLPYIMDRGGQLALLGSGEQWLEAAFSAATARWPGRVAARGGFNDPLAHRIEAGCDFFLMPSRFEPCGMNQLYSMAYGTLPIVHATGGLEDTVVDFDSPGGTGFKFRPATPEGLFSALSRAIDAWYMARDRLRETMLRAMEQRFTWDDTAARYEQVYGWAKEKRRYWRSI